MKCSIDLKHVGPREHVRALIQQLCGHLEERLRHFSPEATTLHVLFDENGSKTLFRTSLSCHVPPRHLLATREEDRDAGVSIRKAFAELEHQVDKLNTKLRRGPHRAALKRPKA